MIINRIIYSLLLFFSLFFIYFQGGKVPYMTFYTVFLLGLVSFTYTLVIYMHFKFNQDLSKFSVIKGETVDYTFSLYNEGFLLYPYIKVYFYSTDKFLSDQFNTKSFSLLPKQSKTYSYKLECKCRGSYTVGIKRIEIEDFLGIFRFRYKINNLNQLIVNPRIIDLKTMNLNPSFISDSHTILNSLHEDVQAISDVRKYIYGDSPKKVHWKLTAKTNELMVKNFESTTESSAVVIFDLKKYESDDYLRPFIEDKLVEAAVGVIHYCLSNWMRINFVYYDNAIVNIEAKSPEEFPRLYDFLAKTQFLQKVNIEDVLQLYLEQFINRNTIIIFTAGLSYDFYNEACRAKDMGNDIIIVYVTAGGDSTAVAKENNIISALSEKNIKTYKIALDSDVKSVLEHHF